MALADCDPGTGVLGVDSSYVVPGMVLAGITLVQGVVKIPALQATWTAISNPYITAVEVEYKAADASSGTMVVSANKGDLKVTPTSGIIAGKNLTVRYRAVGLTAVGDWSSPATVTIPTNMTVTNAGALGDTTADDIFRQINTRGNESRKNALAIAQRAQETMKLTGPGGYLEELAFLNGERIGTYLLRESTERKDGQNLFAQNFSLIGARNATGTAWILDLDTVMLSPVESMASRFAVIQSQTASALAANASNTATVAQEIITRTTETTALASSVTAVSATVSSNFTTLSASVTSEASARVSGDAANATSISTVSATVTSNYSTLSASVTTLSSADVDINGRMSAVWAVALDVNGYVAGIKLMTQGGGGTTTSTFAVRADNFVVYNGSGNDAAFQVSGGVVYIAGNKVKTDSVVANAITYPAVASGAPNLTGTGIGAAHLLGSVNVTLPATGTIDVDFHATQDDTGAGTFKYEIYIGGTLYRTAISNKTMDIISNGVSVAGLGATTYTVQLYWYANTAQIQKTWVLKAVAFAR